MLVGELGEDTVDVEPNYRGRDAATVLPAAPQTVVNGASGSLSGANK